MAGPSIGILLSSDLETEFSGVAFKGDSKDATNTVDVAAAFGAGIRYSDIRLEGSPFFGRVAIPLVLPTL
ncbi:MAG: hypothetical protein ACE5IW_12185 [bacterium]